MADNIQDLKKQIQELRREITSLGGESFKNLNAAIEAAGGGMEGARKVLTRMKKEVEDLKDTFGNISSTLKNTLADLKGQENAINLVNKSYSKLEGIAQKLSNHKKDEEILTVKQLKSLSKQTQEEYNQLKNARDLAKIQKAELETKLKSGNATKKETEEYEKLKNYSSEINSALNLKNSYLKQIVSLSEKEVENEEKIQKTLGVTGGLFKGITKSLEHIGIESEAFEHINKDLREAAKSGSSFKVIGAGLTSIGKGIKESLSDPLVQVALTAKAFHTMYEIGTHFSKETADISKTLGVSSDTAAHMVHHMEAMAASSGDNLANTKDNLSSFKDLNDAFGTSVEFSQKQLLTQTKLKEVAGLTAGEAAKIAEYEQLTGKSAEDVYNSIGKTNKGALSQKKITQEVLKTSGQLAAQYKNNPELLSKAVTQAQRLGMTLEQTKKISQGLLNFEDSISAELEAELLTGQDLNLEKARYLALQGDSAAAAEEMMKNLGPNGLQKFQKMMPIQQEAYAKALGMSADELADSLRKQAALAELEKKRGKGITEQVKKLEAAGETEKAAELQKRVAQGETVELAMQRLDAEANLAKSVDKTKDSLTSMVAGPLGWIVEKANSLLGLLNKIPGMGVILGGLGALAAVGTLIAGVAVLVKTVKGLFVKGPANQTAENTKRTADAVEKIANSGGSSMGGVDGGGDGGTSSKKSKRGRKRGRLGKILGGLGSAMGMASMFGGGGEGEEAGGAIEGMADVADVASSGGGGGGATKAASTAGKTASTAGKAAKGGGLLGKIGGFFGGMGKKIGGGLGGIKKLFSGPIAKGFGKILGPVLSIIESVGSAASLVSDAREKKAMGEKVDAGGLGKSLVQAAAYPIVNLATNLIPGFGQAISIGDGILGSFGKSPIKWLTDNIVDLIPSESFSGLGNLALGEKAEKAMAKGGIVTGPTRALVGEAGTEAVIPLDKFYAKLDELITAVREGGHVYLDGNKVGTAMAMGTFKTQ